AHFLKTSLVPFQRGGVDSAERVGGRLPDRRVNVCNEAQHGWHRGSGICPEPTEAVESVHLHKIPSPVWAISHNGQKWRQPNIAETGQRIHCSPRVCALVGQHARKFWNRGLSVRSQETECKRREIRALRFAALG